MNSTLRHAAILLTLLTLTVGLQGCRRLLPFAGQSPSDRWDRGAWADHQELPGIRC